MSSNQPFAEKWSPQLISERAHYQTFIVQLCALIGVPAPDEERTGDLDYCFERHVRFEHDDGTHDPGYIDCYRRGSFVLEAKQSAKRTAMGRAAMGRAATGKGSVGPVGARVEILMRTAKRQAEQYAKALDEWPPFLIIVDVGRSIELWADFDRQGKVYTPFPDRARQRITLDQLDDPAIRAMLAAVWIDPMSLNPASRVAEVTTDIAKRLAWLVRSIGDRVPHGPDGQGPDAVQRSAHASKTALFVTQCIFATFADSVGLIEDRAFLKCLLKDYRGQARNFHTAASEFFRHMDSGGHCPAVRQDLRRFNGGLFREVRPVQINEEELEALIAAAERDWSMVEPAIFGALLEQALDPRERTELGAHYTPRAYVERLIGPTIMEPLRAEWEAVEGAAIGLHQAGRVEEARSMVRRFHRQLCSQRVLDPACGTGNFLYVAMRMMKELEGEVLGALHELGDTQAVLEMASHSVSPEQFLGIEKNRYAAWIAQMVLWIGHLQWHFRTFGDAKPAEPILRDSGSIQCRDALLDWDRVELVAGARQRTGSDKLAGESSLFDVDDDREVVRYVNPRPARWPDAEFIVGNPPFMGAKDMRRELGDGYVDALWAIRRGRFRSADFVTTWWDRAGELLTRPNTPLRRFGFITTNSISQTFSRRVIESHLQAVDPIRLVYAIADHPWMKGGDRAAVRIAITVAEAGAPNGDGRLCRVVSESDATGQTQDVILDHRLVDIGADLKPLAPPMRGLRANAGLCSRGVQLMGAGFAVPPDQAFDLMRGSDPQLPDPIRPYCNGRDLAERSRGLVAIDLYGLSEGDARKGHPGLFQHLLQTVKADRDRNNREAYRRHWWTFGEPRRDLREALTGLPRYVVTVETAKHRWFRFLDARVLADNKLVVVAVDDPAVLGVLSSRAHTVWFTANSGRIGVYEREAVYVKGVCFDAFPFPPLDDKTRAELGALADELEVTRDRALAEVAGLTMTGIYNLSERSRAGEALSASDQRMFDRGRIGLIHHLHTRIDACVASAYGWAEVMSDVMIQEKLLALHHERAAEEERGLVRHLRPDFQRRRQTFVPPTQFEVDFKRTTVRPQMPQSPEGMAAVLLRTLRSAGRPVEPSALMKGFDIRRRRTAEARIEETLSILAVAGSVQKTDAGWFAPRIAR